MPIRDPRSPIDDPRSAVQAALEQVDALTPEDRQGMRDYWAVYDRDYDQITEYLTAQAEKIGAFSEYFSTLSDAQRRQMNLESRDRMRRLFEDGAWEAYLSNLRTQGTMFAQQGIPYSSWYVLLAAVQYHVIPKLREAYRHDVDRLLRSVVAMQRYIDIAMMVIGSVYQEAREEIIARQQEAICELSTPVLQIRTGLCVLPIIGLMDAPRARLLIDTTLATIRAKRTKVMIVDITGVAIIDSDAANRLLQMVEAARLLGATTIMTGISPEVALTIVSLGLDLSSVLTAGDLESGIEEASRLLKPPEDEDATNGTGPEDGETYNGAESSYHATHGAG